MTPDEKHRIYLQAYEVASDILGADPEYYGKEGQEEVEHQLKLLGYSLEQLREDNTCHSEYVGEWDPIKGYFWFGANGDEWIAWKGSHQVFIFNCDDYPDPPKRYIQHSQRIETLTDFSNAIQNGQVLDFFIPAAMKQPTTETKEAIHTYGDELLTILAFESLLDELGADHTRLSQEVINLINGKVFDYYGLKLNATCKETEEVKQSIREDIVRLRNEFIAKRM